ncbi:hypothetical protein EVAR_55663_1 [Eumeta japonica]|uniref:Uncharacterized protein n=1 Tax=Eumeta variegata TaxID=151549 RepID=A0A4C1XZ78_EUMVA|nr:hypothetical protein EVAR_55663_1 [Eumeta japonica]
MSVKQERYAKIVRYGNQYSLCLSFWKVGVARKGTVARNYASWRRKRPSIDPCADLYHDWTFVSDSSANLPNRRQKTEQKPIIRHKNPECLHVQNVSEIWGGNAKRKADTFVSPTPFLPVLFPISISVDPDLDDAGFARADALIAQKLLLLYDSAKR